MDRIKNYFIRPWDSDAMNSVTPMSDNVREHLFMVYCTLLFSSLFTLSGAISHLLFNNGGWVSAVGFIASVWCLSRINPWRTIRRVLFLETAAYFCGATLGPLINLIIEMDQRNIIKIIMGSILFFSCYLGAIMHSLDRTVIYQYAEYSAPIIIATYMVTSDAYPELRTHVVCLLLLPFQWFIVIRVGAFIGRRLRRWFNLPVHFVWFLFLCYYYNYSFRVLMYVYAFLSWLFIHMNLYNQLAIFRATHDRESYYISTTITFFTEFPVHIVDFFKHTIDVGNMVRTIRMRSVPAQPRTRRSRVGRNSVRREV